MPEENNIVPRIQTSHFTEHVCANGGIIAGLRQQGYERRQYGKFCKSRRRNDARVHGWTKHKVGVPTTSKRVIYHGETTGDCLPLALSRSGAETGTLLRGTTGDISMLGIPLIENQFFSKDSPGRVVRQKRRSRAMASSSYRQSHANVEAAQYAGDRVFMMLPENPEFEDCHGGINEKLPVVQFDCRAERVQLLACRTGLEL